MSRRLFGLLLTCTALAAQAVPARPPAAMTITFADQPVHLVRDISLYSAGRGVQLQGNDMLESAGGAIQLDAGGATVAIGPGSRVFVKDGAELVLLDGWMKVSAPAGRALTVDTAALQLGAAGAIVTVHAGAGVTELFAESGDVAVSELALGKPQRRIKLPHDQFAIRSGVQPLHLAPRLPDAFIAAMPRAFMDTLAPVAARPGAVPPKRERAATFAELAPWLSGLPALRQQLQRRFDPPRPARVAPVRHPTAQQ